MVRKTKKMKTDIQLAKPKRQDNEITLAPASMAETHELDAVLASVFRVFAARGRAIREARERQQRDGV